jgi:hypothetical protein
LVTAFILADTMVMRLLELPTELFEKILHDAFVVRGLKRGMRLRLVNSEYCIPVYRTA